MTAINTWVQSCLWLFAQRECNTDNYYYLNMSATLFIAQYYLNVSATLFFESYRIVSVTLLMTFTII